MANTCGGDDNLFDYVCEGVDEKYVSLARSLALVQQNP